MQVLSKEVEEDTAFFEAYDDLTFMNERTNCSVMKCDIAEADDIIQGPHIHPNDEHVIVSSDTDFVQLLSENVQSQYNGITKETIKLDGVYDDKGKS